MKKQIAAALMTLVSTASFACGPEVVEVICRAPGLELKMIEEGGYVQVQMGSASLDNLNAEQTDLSPEKNMSLAYTYRNDTNQRETFAFVAESSADLTNMALHSSGHIVTTVVETESGTFMKYNYETEREEETPYAVVQTTHSFPAVASGTFQGQSLNNLNVNCSEVIVEDSRYHEEH